MKNYYFIFYIIFSFLFCLVNSSCDTSYSCMLDEYNSNFQHTVGVKTIPKVGENGFDQNQMLSQEEYTVLVGGSFMICAPDAPSQGYIYTWELRNCITDEQKVIGSAQVLNFFVKSSELSIGIAYELTLSIEKDSVRKWTDKATVYFVTAGESV